MPRVTIEYDLSDPDESRLCDENTARLRQIYPNLRVTRVEGLRATIRIDRVRENFTVVDFGGSGTTNPREEMYLELPQTEENPTYTIDTDPPRYTPSRYIGMDLGLHPSGTVIGVHSRGGLTMVEAADRLRDLGTTPSRQAEPLKASPPVSTTWKEWKAAFEASKPKSRFDLMEEEDAS